MTSAVQITIALRTRPELVERCRVGANAALSAEIDAVVSGRRGVAHGSTLHEEADAALYLLAVEDQPISVEAAKRLLAAVVLSAVEAVESSGRRFDVADAACKARINHILWSDIAFTKPSDTGVFHAIVTLRGEAGALRCHLATAGSNRLRDLWEREGRPVAGFAFKSFSSEESSLVWKDIDDARQRLRDEARAERRSAIGYFDSKGGRRTVEEAGLDPDDVRSRVLKKAGMAA